MTDTAVQRTDARYTWGGDEFLFVEIAEAMSLAANYKANAMAALLTARSLPELCRALLNVNEFLYVD